MKLPAKGEPLELGDIAEVERQSPGSEGASAAGRRDGSHNDLATGHVAVGGRLGLGDALPGCRQTWANAYELTLAKDFVEHLDALPRRRDRARCCSRWTGRTRRASRWRPSCREALRHKLVLGLARRGRDTGSSGRAGGGLPGPIERERSAGPGGQQRCDRTKLGSVRQVHASRGAGRAGNWTRSRLLDGLSEGILNRLVRAQLSKGVKDKGKMHYQIRIDNASPWILNGLAALGAASKPDETPKVLWGICVSPRRSLTVPASEEVVKTLGLKKGIKLVALELERPVTPTVIASLAAGCVAILSSY